MTVAETVGAPQSFHDLEVATVLEALDVDLASGLTDDEVRRRVDRHGRNELADAPRRPAWKRFADQFRDLLIGILLVAAVISFLASGELKTPIVVLVVVLLNATIGFVQGNRAEASLDALRRMLVVEVRVRRERELRTIDAAELVPGDVVVVEAGDRIPADGRLLEAVNLEVEEASLTGESTPVAKSIEPTPAGPAPVADRTSMVHMQTTVTRGRGTFVVTTTGMDTEIGRIAHLLREQGSSKTPLQRQLDQLAHSLAKLSGAIVAVVSAIGLARGQELSDVILTAVALAVATIPEGLPAVTAVTLAIGVSRMAHRNAIVKQLASVETLGCTTVVCTDKTGTLTLNQMTAEALVLGGQEYEVTGSGYDPDGTIVGADDVDRLPEVLDAAALCSDAEVRRDPETGAWQVVGDPTEGALVVLAIKGGHDVAARRREWPRVGEVPFDSAHKVMATAHEIDDSRRLRVFVKGAPDVVLQRSIRVLGPHGEVAVDDARQEIEAANHALAEQGMRVLAVADRDLDRSDWDAVDDHLDVVADLTLLALVGIVDPPRPEVAAAVEEAQRAGIQVKMITGDHAATASAIGRQLGLAGPDREVVALTGAELDELDDDQLDARLPDVSVYARVSPEHKMRLVSALQRTNQVVAMTGDGVNDAPALKQADMGIAMGITGTEVTKEAATMVLTDDNFATIVAAVRSGRGIYDNIVKFVRFQLSTTLGFAGVFLVASALGLAGGQPFTAIAILWVNILMDGPPAMALGLDPVDEDAMDRRPRPREEPILTRARWTAIGTAAAVMAAGTLAVLALAPGPHLAAGTPTVAGTMAFNTFVLFQFFNILNVRNDRATVFRRATLANRHLWVALTAVLTLQVGVTHFGPLQDLFDTTAITAAQWLVCAAVASTILVVEEARKAVLRRR